LPVAPGGCTSPRMSSALVGETHIPRDFGRYAREYSFLEIDCEPGTIPGKARLQSCAKLAPEGFVFSLVLPSSLATLQGGEAAERDWKSAQNAARILRARWWVVRTPASVRPTRKAREELAALFERLKAPELRIAWEPHGLWEDSAASETAAALGVHLVQDIAHHDPVPAPVLYARLLAVGRGARVGLGLAERVAERISGFSEAFVAVEGHGARAIQNALGLISTAEAGAAGNDGADDADEIDETDDSDEADDPDEADDSDDLSGPLESVEIEDA
jgi:uncharacterized protein YecE (DUF72 family)